MPARRELAKRPAWRSELSIDKVKGLLPVDLHRPLISSGHIRLLKLYPPGWPNKLAEGLRHDQDPILRCDSYQASRKDLTRPGRALYAALSYVCGHPERTRHITCGARKTGVTSNLYDALLYVRFLDRPRLIWVDSLCIHQRDDAEKSEQVRLMHATFGQAHVVAWIAHNGDPTHASSAFRMLRTLGAATRGLNEDWFTIKAGRDSFKDRVKVIDDSIPIKLERSIGDPSMAYALSLLEANYFQRIWTVQEMILGKSRLVQVNTHTISVPQLCEAQTAIMAFENIGTFLWDACFNARYHLEPDASSSESFCRFGTRFDEFVWQLNSKMCQNPRDHIYALIALDPENIQLRKYEVNYALPADLVFCDFAVRCMRASETLELLSHVQRPTTRSHEVNRTAMGPSGRRALITATGLPDLPSWCPDWAHPYSQVRQLEIYSYKPAYMRGGKLWDAGPTRSFKVDEPGCGTIRLRGVLISKLTSCSASLPQRESAEESSRKLHLDAERVLSHCCGYRNIRGLCMEMITVLTEELSGIHKKTFAPWSPDDTSPAVYYQSILASIGPIYLLRRCPSLHQRAGFMIDDDVSEAEQEHMVDEIDHSVRVSSAGTRFFSTDAGLLGTGHPSIHVGDLVCILYGGKTPFILRQVGNRGHYNFLGECFVEGLMYGEGTRMGLKEQDFILI